MPVTRNEKIAGGIFAGVIATAAAVGLIVADDGTQDAPSATATAVASPAFDAQFGTPDDFYQRFDYGVSGQDTWTWNGGINTFHGDHDLGCNPPTSLRDVHMTGAGAAANLSETFWHCAPGNDPSKGHMMTGFNTVGYNHSWFAPKGYFSDITKVCFDVNETTLSRRKWLEVQFLDQADATRYPAGQLLKISGITVGMTRGSGGFDLGYTSPIFQNPSGPNNMIFPASGNQAGLLLEGFAPSWWQNQTQFTYRPNGQNLLGITDKAARYTQCIENQPGDIVRLTQATPSGVRIFNMPGQIPQGTRKVVFHDVNYNPPKDSPPESPDGTYNPNNLTWHWDNVQVYTAAGGSPPTSPPPTTATTTVTTVVPSTTTSTSTTVPPTTSSTVRPCPLSFAADAQAWCAQVNARLNELEGANV